MQCKTNGSKDEKLTLTKHKQLEAVLQIGGKFKMQVLKCWLLEIYINMPNRR